MAIPSPNVRPATFYHGYRDIDRLSSDEWAWLNESTGFLVTMLPDRAFIAPSHTIVETMNHAITAIARIIQTL
jgi:hypothetical protein